MYVPQSYMCIQIHDQLMAVSFTKERQHDFIWGDHTLLLSIFLFIPTAHFCSLYIVYTVCMYIHMYLQCISFYLLLLRTVLMKLELVVKLDVMNLEMFTMRAKNTFMVNCICVWGWVGVNLHIIYSVLFSFVIPGCIIQYVRFFSIIDFTVSIAQIFSGDIHTLESKWREWKMLWD